MVLNRLIFICDLLKRAATMIRKHLVIVLVLLAVGSAYCTGQETPGGTPAKETSPASPVSPFKCKVQIVVDDKAIPASIFFSSHYAVEFDVENPDRPDVVYDLDAMSWYDFAPPRTIHLKECEAWAQASAERSRKSLAQITDDGLKRFVERTLEPQLEVVQEKDAVTFKNDVFKYRVSAPLTLDATQRKRFFSYDRLNAYRKAMLERKLAPFAQLAVDKELESRGFAPGNIEFTIETPQGAVQVVVKAEIDEISSEEAARVADAIRRRSSPSN
jgi:hypothetical protein